MLTLGNSGAMHWGKDYRHSIACHGKRLNGSFLFGDSLSLNVSNHIRKGEEVPVVQWHRDALLAMGFTMEGDIEVPTARLRYGANHASRVGCEHVLCFRRG